MNNKINIEEIKYLIPDYITGNIDDKDKILVENAISEFPEIREFYNEMKGALEFTGSVNAEEPSPQYWGSLLPRIHQRIEVEEEKKFSWRKVSVLWKVLVPVAAIILIALVYYIIKPSNTQMTKDEKKIEKIDNNKNKDTSKDKVEEKSSDKKLPEDKQEEKLVKEEDKRVPDNKFRKERKSFNATDNNVTKDETPVKEDNNQQLPVKEEVAGIDIEETSVFSAGEGASFDEETENELKKLNNKEQDLLLKELQNTNL